MDGRRERSNLDTSPRYIPCELGKPSSDSQPHSVVKERGVEGVGVGVGLFGPDFV